MSFTNSWPLISIGWREIPVLTSIVTFPDWSDICSLGKAGTSSRRRRKKLTEAERGCFLISMGEISQKHCHLPSNPDVLWLRVDFEQEEWGVSLASLEWCKWKHYQEATADTQRNLLEILHQECEGSIWIAQSQQGSQKDRSESRETLRGWENLSQIIGIDFLISSLNLPTTYIDYLMELLEVEYKIRGDSWK